MLNKNESKKQILKSSSIIGGASFITILIGLVQVKVLALLLGPAGIGLMGLLMTIMTLGSTLFGMGLGSSGVRELALNNQNVDKLNLVRKALFLANFLLGLLAVIVICFFKETLSERFFQSPDYQDSIAIISVGVFFTLVLSSQIALLQGLRKIIELAKVNIIGALSSTSIGLLIIWKFGESGLPFFIIVLPLASFIVALFYNRKLPKLVDSTVGFKQLKSQWRTMFILGFSFMLSSLMMIGSQFIVRYIINQKLNIESVGYFQAAWAISMTYISFVLSAMAADYYPRLTQKIHSKNEANGLVNEQTEIAIIFAAPVLIAMLTFAPIAIHLLYSSEFTASIEILRWQVLGDAFKVVSWPLSFIILAKGRSKLFFCTELLWNGSYVLLVYIGIHDFGIEITGYGFAISYLIYLFTVYTIAWSSNGFQWNRKNIKLILLLTLSTLSLLLLSYFSLLVTMFVGSILVAGATIYAVKTIVELGVKNSKLDRLLAFYKKIVCLLSFKKSC